MCARVCACVRVGERARHAAHLRTELGLAHVALDCAIGHVVVVLVAEEKLSAAILRRSMRMSHAWACAFVACTD
jgi:hypothetical protein